MNSRNDPYNFTNLHHLYKSGSICGVCNLNWANHLILFITFQGLSVDWGVSVKEAKETLNRWYIYVSTRFLQGLIGFGVVRFYKGY